MTIGEYKVLEPNMKIRDRIQVMEREFNRLGEDGWELCSDHGGSYTFKRPRPGPASRRHTGAIGARQHPAILTVILAGSSGAPRGMASQTLELCPSVSRRGRGTQPGASARV